MPITGWIAILVLIVMCYMLIKQYETRMVLFGGGFILCCISLAPMAGLNAFAKTMTNGALITAICSATGFAYCVTYTECDRSLVHYLTRPIRNVGILMIPITSLLTFAINIAIPSAAGVGAVVGTTLIPLLLRAGFKPAAAAAAVLMGTTSGLVSQRLCFRHGSYVHHGPDQLSRHLLPDDRCGRRRRPVHCLLGFGRQQRRKNGGSQPCRRCRNVLL